MKKKTINAFELSTLHMGNGEGKPNIVIDNGVCKEYVGIGWVNLDKAVESDYDKYPEVVRVC